MAGAVTHRLVVEAAGGRLDKFVAEGCPELSRTQAQNLIEDGDVTVNGETARPGLRLATGDRIEVRVPPAAGRLFQNAARSAMSVSDNCVAMAFMMRFLRFFALNAVNWLARYFAFWPARFGISPLTLTPFSP